jgi:hypothetical protein
MTTANEMDKLLHFLCHGETHKLANLKFFRGERDLIAPEELCRQAHSALEQKRLNLATVSAHPPDGDGEPVDVQTLVDSL